MCFRDVCGKLLNGKCNLTLTTLWFNSADDKLIYTCIYMFSYFSQKTGFDISCKLSPLSSVEKFTRVVER